MDETTVVQLVACLREGSWIEYEEMLRTPHWHRPSIDVTLTVLKLTGLIQMRSTPATSFQWIDPSKDDQDTLEALQQGKVALILVPQCSSSVDGRRCHLPKGHQGKCQ